VLLGKRKREAAWQELLSAKRAQPALSLSSLAADRQLDKRKAQRRWKHYESCIAAGASHSAALLSASSDSRGGHNRAFTPEHEQLQLAQIVRSSAPSLTHTQIQTEALQLQHSIAQATHTTHLTRSAPPPFHASDHFISAFKRRHRLSSHRTAVKHISRAERERDMELEKIAFVVEVRDAIHRCGASFVLNMDETPVQLLDVPVTAVVSTGSGQAATVTSTAGSLGSKITTMPTISAAGEKLQLCAILKGKTERCLAATRAEASDEAKKIQLYYSHKGWMNEGIMALYFRDILLPYTRCRPAALLLDSYTAHFTDAVRSAAAAMNLQLIQVPASCTAELQPLDVGFNGPLSMKRKQLWAEQKIAAPATEDTRARALDRAQRAYSALPKSTAQQAYRKAFLID
jgi:hypothetical protein